MNLLRIHPHILILAALLALLPGCEDGGDMHDQPRYEPLEGSAFFDNGTSARPIPPGTIPRERWIEDEAVRTGRRDGTIVREIPLPVTMEMIRRGRERFNIYCTPCHGGDGYGRGMIVQRGYTPPPSLHIDRLRAAPDGHFFSVITDGFGRMPSYAQQVRVEDRWAIIAYMRALQLSQHAAVSDLPPEMRGELEEEEP